jgi:hypothetical protein
MEDVTQDAGVKDFDTDVTVQDCCDCVSQEGDGVAHGLEFVGRDRDTCSEVKIEQG